MGPQMQAAMVVNVERDLLWCQQQAVSRQVPVTQVTQHHGHMTSNGIWGMTMVADLCSSCCCMKSFSSSSFCGVMSYFFTSTAGDALTGS